MRPNSLVTSTSQYVQEQCCRNGWSAVVSDEYVFVLFYVKVCGLHWWLKRRWFCHGYWGHAVLEKSRVVEKQRRGNVDSKNIRNHGHLYTDCAVLKPKTKRGKDGNKCACLCCPIECCCVTEVIKPHTCELDVWETQAIQAVHSRSLCFLWEVIWKSPEQLFNFPFFLTGSCQ